MPRVVLEMALLRLDDSLALAVGLLRVRASRCLTPRGGEASRINKKGSILSKMLPFLLLRAFLCPPQVRRRLREFITRIVRIEVFVTEVDIQFHVFVRVLFFEDRISAGTTRPRVGGVTNRDS